MIETKSLNGAPNGTSNVEAILPSKMHKDIRNDPEVAAKLDELDKAARVYMAFDM